MRTGCGGQGKGGEAEWMLGRGSLLGGQGMSRDSAEGPRGEARDHLVGYLGPGAPTVGRRHRGSLADGVMSPRRMLR